MSAADGIVLPKPQIPKTLGILNIIFGVLLVLLGSCTIGMTLIAPSLQQYSNQFKAQIKQQAEARRQARLQTLEEEEKAATTEAEKASLKAQRDALAASPVPVAPTADLQGFDQFKDPTIRNFTVIQQGTGILWDIALIVAGIGLVRLKEWGRSLGAWLAGIQIVRIVLLTLASLVVVAPVQKKFADKQVEAMEAKVKAGNASPAEASAVQMTRIMSQLAPVFTLAYALFGMIYPAISLWLLNMAGTRAAVLPRKPEGFLDLPGAP